MKDTTDNYIDLANAVLVKAIDDYKMSIAYILKHPTPSKRYLEAVKYINEVESFFNSKRSDFYITSNIIPRDLFNIYKRMHKDEIDKAMEIIELNNHRLQNKRA